MELIGMILKHAIKGKGLTVEVAARKLGISRQTLSNYFKYAEFDKNFLRNVKTNLGIVLIPSAKGSSVKTELLINSDDGGKLVPYYDLDVTAGDIEIFSGGK